MAQNVFLKEPAATKVQIVNQDGSEVVKAEIENFPLQDGSFSVDVANTVKVSIRPTTGTTYTIQLDNILLLQGDGTLVPVPLNTYVFNITITQINSVLESYKTAYATLVSGITAATLHYSKMSSTGVTTSEVYNLKD